LPADLPLLARVFPVLQRLVPGESMPTLAGEPPDRQILRRRAFTALRTLLGRMAARQPLVVAIHDLQWGDADDAPLPLRLFRPAPPGPAFGGSSRTEDADTNPRRKALRNPADPDEPGLARRELAVEALSQSEARELALTLFGSDQAVARAEAHLIARESHGNP